MTSEFLTLPQIIQIVRANNKKIMRHSNQACIITHFENTFEVSTEKVRTFGAAVKKLDRYQTELCSCLLIMSQWSLRGAWSSGYGLRFVITGFSPQRYIPLFTFIDNSVSNTKWLSCRNYIWKYYIKP